MSRHRQPVRGHGRHWMGDLAAARHVGKATLQRAPTYAHLQCCTSTHRHIADDFRHYFYCYCYFYFCLHIAYTRAFLCLKILGGQFLTNSESWNDLPPGYTRCILKMSSAETAL